MLLTSLGSVQVCKHIGSASGLPVYGAKIYTKQQRNGQTSCTDTSLPSAPSAPFDPSPQQPEQLSVAPISPFFGNNFAIQNLAGRTTITLHAEFSHFGAIWHHTSNVLIEKMASLISPYLNDQV